MKYNFRIKHNKDFDTDLVDMKCLECDYEEEVPLDILLEFFDSSVDHAPTLTCPHCDEIYLFLKMFMTKLKVILFINLIKTTNLSLPRLIFLLSFLNTISYIIKKI